MAPGLPEIGGRESQLGQIGRQRVRSAASARSRSRSASRGDDLRAPRGDFGADDERSAFVPSHAGHRLQGQTRKVMQPHLEMFEIVAGVAVGEIRVRRGSSHRVEAGIEDERPVGQPGDFAHRPDE